MSSSKPIRITDAEDPASSEKHLDNTSGMPEHRRTIRYLAALLSGLTAFIYFLIGFNAISVVDTDTSQIFGIPAGIAYAFGALLLIALDSRPLWILGAILQAFVIYTYFDLAPQRTPEFEVWGIVLRIAQLLILIALAYLAIRPSLSQAANRDEGRE